MQPDYTYWKAALAGEKPAMHDADPQPGFYRLRSKNKQTSAISWKPVAYWYAVEDSRIHCVVGDQEVSEERGQELWSYLCQAPVTEEAYRLVTESGGNWPDQDAIVASQTERGIGDNSNIDEFDLLKDQIESANVGVSGYKKISSQEEAERGQSLRSRLLELSSQADKARKKIADPLHKEWKTVNEKWKPLIEMADKGSADIKKSSEAFLTEQLKLQRAAEEIAQALVSAEAEMIEPELVKLEPVKTQLRGGYGRAASVKSEWTLTGITDLDAVYTFFKTSSAVRECLEDLAKRAIKTGVEIPGTTREERAVSR